MLKQDVERDFFLALFNAGRSIPARIAIIALGDFFELGKKVRDKIKETTGIEVSTEKEEKIINTIINDKVPNDLEKYI